LAFALAWAGGVRAADAEARHEVRDPYFGQSLFDFFQDRYFTALTELMVSQHFDRLRHHVDEAEILRGGLYLSYGLHREAAEVFTRLIDKGAPPAIRDRAWFYLAKIRYQRGLAAQAEEALGRIRAPLPQELEIDRMLLKGNLLMGRGDFAGAADALRPLAVGENTGLYARFNLGVALIRNGAAEAGRKILDEVGKVPANTEEYRALRDKANVALGFAALRDNQPEHAKEFLERVRLNGMLADKALLGYGWAADAMHDAKSALVSWTELSGREPGDAAVLESKLAVPYALVKEGDEGLALQKYGVAIADFDEERARLDESIGAIRAGKLVDGLVALNPGEEMGWFWNIDRLPEMRHGAHLVRVLAMHEFQEGFKNYRDLLFLERNLHQWLTNLDVIGEMLANRSRAFAERLPLLGMQQHDAALARLDERELALGTELDQAAQAGDGSVFADDRERALAARLERARAALARIEAFASGGGPGSAQAPGETERDELRARLRRAEGALGWELGQEFPVRLWDTKKDFKQLAVELAQAHEHEKQLLQAQLDEPRRFEAFAARIEALRARVLALEPRLGGLIAEQRVAVQELAVAELEQQKQELAEYGSQARFAVAQIYDRAATRSERETGAEKGAEKGAVQGPAHAQP
jgi:hypothetical protein